jgi:hypothetical protein
LLLVLLLLLASLVAGFPAVAGIFLFLVLPLLLASLRLLAFTVSPTVAFIIAVACVHAVASGHADQGVLNLVGVFTYCTVP